MGLGPAASSARAVRSWLEGGDTVELVTHQDLACAASLFGSAVASHVFGHEGASQLFNGSIGHAPTPAFEAVTSRLLAFPSAALGVAGDAAGLNSSEGAQIRPSWSLDPVQVLIGGRVCLNVSVLSDGMLECDVPPGIGALTDVEVRVCGVRLPTARDGLVQGLSPYTVEAGSESTSTTRVLAGRSEAIVRARMEDSTLAALGDWKNPLSMQALLPWPPLLSRNPPEIAGVIAPPRPWRWTNASDASMGRPVPLLVSGRGFGVGAFEPAVSISVGGV